MEPCVFLFTIFHNLKINYLWQITIATRDQIAIKTKIGMKIAEGEIAIRKTTRTGILAIRIMETAVIRIGIQLALKAATNVRTTDNQIMDQVIVTAQAAMEDTLKVISTQATMETPDLIMDQTLA